MHKRIDSSLSGVRRRSARTLAFTLIELLVVIAIIGILAAMIIGMAGPAARNRIKARVRAEMTQIETCIEEYKADRNTYPPDNTNDATHPPLVYELRGATLDAAGTAYNLPNGDTITKANYQTAFARAGIINAQPLDSDEKSRNYMIGIKSQQHTNITVNGVDAEYFIVPVEYAPNTGLKTNTWRYVSTTPTNNGEGHFDLWADINIGGKTERISNWNQ